MQYGNGNWKKLYKNMDFLDVPEIQGFPPLFSQLQNNCPYLSMFLYLFFQPNYLTNSINYEGYLSYILTYYCWTFFLPLNA